jgi:heme/copper-type cytochrome/quinol oxidase subunit 4
MYVSSFLKISAVIFITWGVAYIFAGGLLLNADAAIAINGFTGSANPDLLPVGYPDAIGGLVNHHGWTLIWFGAAVILGAVYILTNNLTAIWMTALIVALVEFGYFLFMGQGSLVTVLPANVITSMAILAIVLCLIAYIPSRRMYVS